VCTIGLRQQFAVEESVSLTALRKEQNLFLRCLPLSPASASNILLEASSPGILASEESMRLSDNMRMPFQNHPNPIRHLLLRPLKLFCVSQEKLLLLLCPAARACQKRRRMLRCHPHRQHSFQRPELVLLKQELKQNIPLRTSSFTAWKRKGGGMQL